MLAPYLDLPRPVHILCLGTFVNRAGSFVLIFLTIYVSERLNMGVPFATFCIGIFGVGSMIASIVGGQLADQMGRRPVMLLALFGGATMLIVLCYLRTKYAIAGGILSFALLNECYRPAASAMIGDLVTPAQRPHAFGLMYVAINLGFAVGPPVGGWLAGYSFDLLFWGDALTTAAYGIIILAFISETRPRRTVRGFPVDPAAADVALRASDVPVSEPPQHSEMPTSFALAARRIVTDTPFMVFCAATLLMTIVFMQGISTLPIYMRSCGIEQSRVGQLLAINGAMIFLLQMPLTHVLSRFERLTVIAVGGIIIAIGIGLTAFADSAGAIALTIILWTFGEMTQAPFTQSVVTDLAPPDLRGRYMGMFSMTFSASLTIGAPVGGIVFSRYGSRTLWAGSFVVAMMGVCLYAIVHRTIKHQRGFREETVTDG